MSWIEDSGFQYRSAPEFCTPSYRVGSPVLGGMTPPLRAVRKPAQFDEFLVVGVVAGGDDGVEVALGVRSLAQELTRSISEIQPGRSGLLPVGTRRPGTGGRTRTHGRTGVEHVDVGELDDRVQVGTGGPHVRTGLREIVPDDQRPARTCGSAGDIRSNPEDRDGFERGARDRRRQRCGRHGPALRADSTIGCRPAAVPRSRLRRHRLLPEGARFIPFICFSPTRTL